MIHDPSTVRTDTPAAGDRHTWTPRSISAARRQLLALPSPEMSRKNLLDAALFILQTHLGGHFTFLEEPLSRANGPLTSVAVVFQESFLGTLLVKGNVPDRESLRELAAILGLLLVNAQQAQELAAMESDSEEMLRYAPDIILVVGGDGTIRMANHKALAFIGLPQEDVAGMPLDAVLGSETPPIETLEAHGRNQKSLEMEIIGARGRRLAAFNVSLVTQPTGLRQILLVGRDITTERQTELAVRRNARATLMSQTIDYLIHEINNPLAAIIANVSLATRRMQRLKTELSHPGHESVITELDKLAKSLTGANKAGERLTGAMSALRDTNRKRRLCRPMPVDPHKEIALALGAVESDYPSMNIIRHLADMPCVVVPPMYIAEIVNVLVKNAVDACNENDSQKAKISVTGSVQDRFLVLVVEDNGRGVPVHARTDIFMPFYTTKPLGEALGLGLAMASDMARRMSGTLRVDDASTLGGACFTLTIPLES